MGTLGKHWKLSETTRAKMRKPKSAEHRAAISAARKGKAQRKPGFKQSEETKRRISEKATGRHASEEARKPGYWTGIKRCPQSPEWRANISMANFGRPAYFPKQRFYYRNIPFRSSWEVLLAKAFDERGIGWEYETHKFNLGSQTYTPDFYLREQECYWEVKGWYGPKAKETVNLFRKKYPVVPLVVATREVLKAMGIKSPNLR